MSGFPKLEDRYSAKVVASLALGASLWLFLTITLELLPWPEVFLPHHKINWLWMSVSIALLALAVAAGILMYRALAAFQRGIDAQIWDEPSLHRLKARLDHPAVTAAIWTFTVAAIGYLIFDLLTRHIGSPHRHPSIGGFAYFWLSPLTAVGTLRRALRPRLDPSHRPWRDELKPIVSSHWGDRDPAHS